MVTGVAEDVLQGRRTRPDLTPSPIVTLYPTLSPNVLQGSSAFHGRLFGHRFKYFVADQSGDPAIIQITQAKEWCLGLHAGFGVHD
jgi:hypothetical protein